MDDRQAAMEPVDVVRDALRTIGRMVEGVSGCLSRQSVGR
jgi:hypothetical protein